MTVLSFDALNRRWPHAAHDLVLGVAASAAETFAKYGLTTSIEQSDLLAQISEETGAGTAVSENLNYSATRLMQVWPSRFPTLASAVPYANNPKGLADNVYGGRGGNRFGTEDGWNFRGRGAMEITFHDGYAMIAKVTGLDCVIDPDLVSAPENFLACACAFWKNADLNPIADSGNFRLETLRINGGYTNLAARLQWRTIWRQELGVRVSPTIGIAAPLAASVVGSVSWIQSRLNACGASPPLIVDGNLGDVTKAAIGKFQATRGLTPDEIAGAETIKALSA